MDIKPLDHPLGNRISVRGSGGKTTLAKAISSKYELPHIELDAINWLPGWEEREPEDFRELTSDAIQRAGEKWVVDGNYGGKLTDLVMSQSDSIIFLNLPWRVIFRRSLFREINRARTKQKVCGENTVSWRSLFSRDSLWWLYIANRKQLMNRIDRLEKLVPAGIPVIEIRTTRELKRFYKIHGLVRGG